MTLSTKENASYCLVVALRVNCGEMFAFLTMESNMQYLSNIITKFHYIKKQASSQITVSLTKLYEKARKSLLSISIETLFLF